MKLEAVIFDIDGTLADNTHRQHYLEKSPKDWDGFFSEMEGDSERLMVKRVLYQFEQSGYEIILVTGRYSKYGAFTAKWLEKYNIPYHQLIMRPDEDSRPDYEVKKELYETRIAPLFNVCLVVDDRSSVVKMWRELGLECWQVAEGNF